MDALLIASNLTLYLLLTVAVFQDFKTFKISNRLILIGLVLGLGFRLIRGGPVGVLHGIPTILFPIFILYLFYLMGVLGAGDIKLFSLIGGFINLKELTGCMMWAFMIGAIISLGKMLKDRTLFNRLFLGKMYFKGIANGEVTAYPYKTKESLIHFSLSILIGLLALQTVGSLKL